MRSTGLILNFECLILNDEEAPIASFSRVFDDRSQDAGDRFDVHDSSMMRLFSFIVFNSKFKI